MTDTININSKLLLILNKFNGLKVFVKVSSPWDILRDSSWFYKRGFIFSLTKVLRDQPDDIVKYAAHYFECLNTGKPFEY